MTEESCKTCRFWREVAGSEGPAVGSCRRSPPPAGSGLGMGGPAIGNTAWPLTADFDWCGEYCELPRNCEQCGVPEGQPHAAQCPIRSRG